MATRTQSATRTRKSRSKGAYAHRIQRLHRDAPGQLPQRNATLDCGWGRLLFGQTFDDPAKLAAALLEEDLERRDIAAYVRDPHVVLAAAPQELFLDPSHTYRLDLSHLPRLVAPAARLRGALADQRGGRRRGEPHLSLAQDGAGAPGPAARQARQPHHRLPGGGGREDRRGDRHGDRGRPPARLRRPGGRRLAVVPGGAPAGGAFRRWARRWCVGWRSISRRAARRTWTSR